jgi:hypothetical protein
MALVTDVCWGVGMMVVVGRVVMSYKVMAIDLLWDNAFILRLYHIVADAMCL